VHSSVVGYTDDISTVVIVRGNKYKNKSRHFNSQAAGEKQAVNTSSNNIIIYEECLLVYHIIKTCTHWFTLPIIETYVPGINPAWKMSLQTKLLKRKQYFLIFLLII